ncbi:MAG: glycosyltransferase family 39 protein, partial [Candidatus Margulisiibacteriota bacterium]
MEKIKVIFKSKEFWILIAILAVGAFLRLYKISEYMTFLGDEGRDVIIVRRFLTELHPPLIGAGTSVGNMYLGPLYYYMMAPALLLANFSPVGPAVQIAILGIITIAFVWWVGREWFPSTGSGPSVAGLVAAGLYAISPTVIWFSRSSWNPNIMPFFSLLSIYSIWKVYESREASREVGCWLIILGISLAFVLQSHYLGLLLFPTVGIFWLLTLKKFKSDKSFLRKSLISLFIFLGLMSPLLIFDIRHGWTNFNAIKIFFTASRDIGLPFLSYFTKIESTSVMLFANLIAAKNIYLGILTIIICLIFLLWIYKKKLLTGTYILLYLWLIIGIVGVSFYKGAVYDHYLGFLFPAPFLLMGAIAQKFKKTFIPFFLIIIYFSLINSPILSSPNMQMPRAISVAKVIQEKANGERFNLATISDLNNRDVYQYFLTIWGAKVVDVDPSLQSLQLP